MTVRAKKAFDLYMKCANKNHKLAQYMVGACYEDGIGVEKNYDKAFEWYTRKLKYFNIHNCSENPNLSNSFLRVAFFALMVAVPMQP